MLSYGLLYTASVWAGWLGYPRCKLKHKRSGAVWACREDLAAHNRHFVSLIGNKREQIKSHVQLPRLVDIYSLITLFMAAAFAKPRPLSLHVSLTYFFFPKYSLLASLHSSGSWSNNGSVYIRKGQTYTLKCSLWLYTTEAWLIILNPHPLFIAHRLQLYICSRSP